MKQRFLLLLAISIASFTSSAQTSDPAAKAILDGVSAKFRTYKAVQAGFTLKIEDAKGKLQGTKKGTVFMKGAKYKVAVTGQEIFCDGKNVWTYDKAANEVTITKFEPSANSITPQKIFTDFYDKDFLYKLNGEKTENGKVIQEIELTPTDKTRPFFKVMVYVDKKTKNISSSKVLEKSGNKITYGISNLNGNTNIADEQFVFDKKKYPGVEEVDLR